MTSQLFKLILGISLCFLLSQTLFPADSTLKYEKSDIRYGLFGHYGINNHISDFRKLPGIPNCCPKFEEGSGSGFKFGFLVEFPLFESMDLELRAGYISLNGDLSTNESTTVIMDGRNQDGEFKHELNATLSDVFLEPLLSYNLFDHFRVFAGVHLGYLITKKYEQAETIVQPSGMATFLDSLGNDSFSRIRNQSSGDIPEYSGFQLFLTAGINYEFPLTANRSLVIAPEISYTKCLTNIVSEKDWKVDPLSFGLVVKYRPVSKISKAEETKIFRDVDTIEIVSPDYKVLTHLSGIPEVRYDTLVTAAKIVYNEHYTRTDTAYIPKKFKLEADIIAVGVDKDGNEIPNPKFRIEEFLYTRLHPLLNYVFFDENSSAIPGRYTTLNADETKSFDEDQLGRVETMNIYWHILNIVGKRMSKLPGAKLKIIGCNCDLGAEKGRKDLSMKRAEAVRDYLQNIWNIDGKRLTLESRNLSATKSTPISDPEKMEENRRVELSSNVYDILKPILTRDTLRTSNPPIARFKPVIVAEAGINEWRISAVMDEEVSTEFRSNDYLKGGEIPEVIDWDIDGDIDNIWKIKDRLNYSLSARDKRDNETQTKEKSLGIEQITLRKKVQNRIKDKIIDKYNLILFDFDKSVIRNQNKKIADFIKKRIKPESVIEITGYTDRTGDFDHNMKLSRDRAKSTVKAIGRNDAIYKGVGETKLLYDNELPEGRFYCRTVEIVVETITENQ